MKRMYAGMMASAEITVKELRFILKNEKEEKWENVLRTYAVDDDMNPQMYKESEDEAEADGAFNSKFEFDEAGGLCHITCTVLTNYYTDDDGEFLEGGDWDYVPCMTQEQMEQIRRIVEW